MDDKYEQDNGYSAVYTAPQSSGCTGPEPEKKQKKSVQLTMSKVIALALCCSLVGGILGAGGVALLGGGKKDSTTILEGERPSSALTVAQIDTSREMTPAEVYAQNVNSTVGITTSVTTNFWGYQTTAAVSGSGFILTEDGYILTNFHVIEDSKAITVTAYDGTTYDATVVGDDESNDIAVLKVEAEGLTPVVLGDSDDLNVGDTVVAIGNPLGSGVVSALDREVTMSSGVTMDLIQTDCAINSGNSGGALFNLYGEVIGITNAKYSGSGSSGQASIDNIGFAIPINSVRNIVESIIENGYIVKPYIGVSVTDVSAETQSYGLPQGAAVKEVTEGSPAEQAGLQVNDIITRVGDTEITCSDDLVSLVKECQAGDELVMQVYRSGETLELTVTVAEKQQSALEVDDESQKSAQSNSQMINPWQFFFGGQS